MVEIMGYKKNEIEKVNAEKIRGSYKTDVQVQVKIQHINGIDLQNLQVKLVTNEKGFNQIDKDGLINMMIYGIFLLRLKIFLKGLLVN